MSFLDKYLNIVQEIRLINPVGRVHRVRGCLVESFGPESRIGEICRITTSNGRIVLAEVVGFEGRRVFLVPYSGVETIDSGSEVVALGQGLTIHVGSDLLGRVLNGLGEGIDGKEDLHLTQRYPIYREPPSPLERIGIRDVFATGIRSIDALLTLGKGQRVGIFSGAGVGKSSLLGMIARSSKADVNVVGLIGERGREVRDFIEQDLGEEGLRKSVVVVSTGDAAPIMRVRSAFLATAVAEYFRDCGNDVLLMMDSLTRFARAQREVGLSLGEPPTMRGYPVSVYSLIPRLIERAGALAKGSITALYTVLVEGEDFNEPIADNVRGYLDGHIHLSKKLADSGYYPAIDILGSISRLMPQLLSERYQDCVRKVREVLSVYRENEDLILIGAYVPGTNPHLDYAMKMIGTIQDLFRQKIGESFPFQDTINRLCALFEPADSRKKQEV